MKYVCMSLDVPKKKKIKILKCANYSAEFVEFSAELQDILLYRVLCNFFVHHCLSISMHVGLISVDLYHSTVSLKNVKS